MRRTITVVTTALLVGTGSPAGAETAGTTVGQISAPDIVLADDSCVGVPVAYDFTDIPTDDFWTLNLESTSDTGVIAGGFGGESGSMDAYWCPSDLPGSFTLSGMLEVMDHETGAKTQEFVVLGFRVVKRRTSTTFKVSDATPRAKQTIHVRGCVSSSGHRDPWRDVIIQVRRPGGDWRRLTKTYTNEVGCFSEPTYAETAGTAYVRARVPATPSRTGVYSKTIKVRVHR